MVSDIDPFSLIIYKDISILRLLLSTSPRMEPEGEILETETQIFAEEAILRGKPQYRQDHRNHRAHVERDISLRKMLAHS